MHERSKQQLRDALTVQQTCSKLIALPFFLRPFLHTSFVVLDALVNPRYAKAPPSFSLSVVLATLCVILPLLFSYIQYTAVQCCVMLYTQAERGLLSKLTLLDDCLLSCGEADSLEEGIE